MTYEEFVSKAVQQDVRNVFIASKKTLDIIPVPLKSFYNNYNPIDVEIGTPKYGAIRFYGIEELKNLQDQYYFYPNDVFIFATCNGDPFFVGKDNHIYTSLHSRFCPEIVAKEFTDFLDMCFE